VQALFLLFETHTNRERWHILQRVPQFKLVNLPDTSTSETAFNKKSVYVQKKSYLCSRIIIGNGMLGTTQITFRQPHLLKLFSCEKSESCALEIRDVLIRHFQSRRDEESAQLWDTDILDGEMLNKLRQKDLYAKR